MLGAAEPVELGLIASLARPGGNVTGLSWSVNLEIIAKGLELLKETLPRIRRVAILWNPANPAQALGIGELKVAARSLGLQLELVETREPNEFDGAFAEIAKRRAEAILVVADALFVVHRARLAELEARYRLPSIHGLRQNVDAGGLMSYGPSTVAVWRRAALLWTRSSGAPSPPTCPSSSRASTSWLSICRPPRRSGCRSRNPCGYGRTRS